MIEEGLAALIAHIKEIVGTSVEGVYTHPPLELRYPYILLDPREVNELVHKTYVKADLYIFSTYTGMRETLQIANTLMRAMQKMQVGYAKGYVDCLVKKRYFDIKNKVGKQPLHCSLLALRLFIHENVGN